jgi:hypothetical protein
MRLSCWWITLPAKQSRRKPRVVVLILGCMRSNEYEKSDRDELHVRTRADCSKSLAAYGCHAYVRSDDCFTALDFR